MSRTQTLKQLVAKLVLEKKLNCVVVKPPLASRPTEAVKFVEAVVVRLVALILLSRTEENLFEVVPRLFDEFFFLSDFAIGKHFNLTH